MPLCHLNVLYGPTALTVLCSHILLSVVGKEVAKYIGPAPPKGGGTHRYVLILLGQEGAVPTVLCSDDVLYIFC
jgi:phosphatidylethanolamine-binding protein (PEBP) family uncharacterized protein